MWSEIIYAPGIKINWKWANLQPFHTSFYFLELQTNICSHSFLDLSNMILRFIPVGACCTKISFNFLTLFQRPLFPLSGPMTDTEAVLVKVGFCLTTRLWMWSRSVGKWIFSNRCICVPLKARFQFPTKRNIDKVIVFFSKKFIIAQTVVRPPYLGRVTCQCGPEIHIVFFTSVTWLVFHKFALY